MRIALVNNAPPTSGMGKPARLLMEKLRETVDVDDVFLDARRHTISRNGEVITRVQPFTHLKPVAWLRLGRALHLEGHDVVHLTNQSLAFLVPRFAEPVVVTVWDLIERVEPQEIGGGLAARLLYRGIPRAQQVITVSRATAEMLASLYGVRGDRVTIIPPAASPALSFVPNVWGSVGGRSFLARQKLDLREAIVLYVGSEHPRKNLRRLLEAMARTVPAVPNLRFVKVGNPGVKSGRVELLETAARLGLTNRVRIVQESTDDDLLYWYHAATVFAFPSLLEGFGFGPLEAMACGTPVVTSRRSSLPEVVGDAAVLVDPENVSEIAQALGKVLSAPSLRTELREKGLRRAREFSWEKATAATLEVYRRVIREAGTPISQ